MLTMPRRLHEDEPEQAAPSPDVTTPKPRSEQPPPGPTGRSVDLDSLVADWRLAFEAAQNALRAASRDLPPNELHEHTRRLADERDSVTRLLGALAHEQHAEAPLMLLTASASDAKRLLGLPPAIAACVFNLDGVLIGSAAIHARAWTETFDEFISRRVERTGGQFAPFNPRLDYPTHIHGRPRLEGVRTFLASRGISLPEGDARDRPGAETVHGLANRKNQALLRLLDEQGVTAFDGARRFLQLADVAGVRRAVVSASANTATILERAGLAGLIDATVDGRTMVAEGLRAKPAPDALVAACRSLGVTPQQTAVFETTPAGVAAGRSGGFDLVVGVDPGGTAAALRGQGADVVVTNLVELFDRRRAA
jgi:HAD superfamily hydrolase (TIGR01509 family)